MDKRYWIGLLIFLLTATTNVSVAQFSLGGGVSTFHGINLPVNRIGGNIFLEVPRTPENTLFVRAAYMLPNKDRQTLGLYEKEGFTPTDENLTTEKVTKTSYFAVDGGTRYYLFNQYDIGFAVFAGGHIKGILSSYSYNYHLDKGLNPDDYLADQAPSSSGGVSPPEPIRNLNPQYSLLFAFGGTIGVKYQLPIRGALMFDMGLEVITRLYDPYAILGNDISPLSVSFNLGYRFDWY